MELGTIIGMVAGVAFIILSMLITGSWAASAIFEFLDPASAMVVFGGSFASAFISVKLSLLITAFKAVKFVFTPPKQDSAEAIDTIVKLANTARKEGVLALEETANNMEDPFLKKGIMLIVDGTDPDLVKDIMTTELAYVSERHGVIATFWENLASYAPAWGMLGTMIGLVLMLGQLDDPNNLGPMMAIALITTFYGCILANFLANPICFKLKQISSEEILSKTVLVEGMLSVQAGDNPRNIEEKLKSFLSPANRQAVGAAVAGEAE